MFRFKQFAIRQENSAMKIGTDAVLLGSIATHASPRTVLDIGSGTGIVGLMMAQRFPKAEITQIDLDIGAFKDTAFNQANSPFKERMSAIHANFLTHDFDKEFDLIVCNPPFHQEQSRSTQTERDQARHQEHLPFKSLLEKTLSILAANGLIFLIMPVNQRESIRQASIENNIFIQEVMSIKPKRNKATNRIIVSLSLNKTTLKETSFVVRDDDNNYSDRYKRLTSEFHLDSSKV